MLKISLRKDYYKILGISKEATDNEIKKAYRKKALQHHPGVLGRLEEGVKCTVNDTNTAEAHYYIVELLRCRLLEMGTNVLSHAV